MTYLKMNPLPASSVTQDNYGFFFFSESHRHSHKNTYEKSVDSNIVLINENYSFLRWVVYN